MTDNAKFRANNYNINVKVSNFARNYIKIAL